MDSATQKPVPFIPFSSGTCAEVWYEDNCWNCRRYDHESDGVCKGCPEETEFTLAALMQEDWPSQHTLDFIGITRREDGWVKLPDDCAGWEDPDSYEPRTRKPKPVDPNQGKLFPELEPGFGDMAAEGDSEEFAPKQLPTLLV